MGATSTRLGRGCCCCVNSTDPKHDFSTATGGGRHPPCKISGHAPDCQCSGPRRYISGVDAASAAEYNDGAEDTNDEFDDTDVQKGPTPYAQASMPLPSHQYGAGRSRTRQRIEDDDASSDDEDEFAHSGQEPGPRSLTEAQIQALIQQQVARLNARLNELDEELAAEEEEAEAAADQQEAQIHAQQQQNTQQTRDNRGPAKPGPTT